MDYLDAMRAFVQTARSGTMSAAARELGISVALLSKRVARLEARLGARLFHRTTRRMSLSDPGQAFLDRAQQILSDIEDAESEVAGLQNEPRGELRVSASVTFGRKHIVPLVARLLARFPLLRVHMQLEDRYVDVIGERLDLAIRIGPLADSTLVARRIAVNRRVIVATPAYLERHGIPETPDDLTEHNCLISRHVGSTLTAWPFQYEDGVRHLQVHGQFDSNNGEALHAALMDHVGISMQSTWNVADELRDGSLTTVLREYTTADASIFAVYPPTRHVSPKVRTFIDEFLVHVGDPPYWDRGLSAFVD